MVLTSWADRLDARGYHRVSITRPNVTCRWDGETTTSTENGRTWVDGKAVIAFDPANEEQHMKLCVGDACYLKGQAKGKPAEIVQIVDMFADDKGDFWLGVKFFWRPEKLTLPDDLDWHERELFIQIAKNKEENWAGLIELTPVTITQLHDASDLGDLPAHHYFYRRAFDPDMCDVIELTPPAGAPAAETAATADAAAPEAADAAPMDVDPTTTQQTPAAPRAPRRNETKERLAALEAQVAALSSQAARADALALQVADLTVKLEVAETKLAQLDLLTCRVSQLEVGL